MKHVVFMTALGCSIFGYMGANGFWMIGWSTLVILTGLFTGILK